MRYLVVLVAATIVASVASVVPASASVPSPCKVVTTADAKKALGGPVHAGRLLKVGLYQSCTYAGAGARAVTVLERQMSRGSFDTSAKRNPGPVAKVPGLATDAYSVSGGQGLLLWKSGTEISLLVSGVRPALKPEETLGRAAASRL